MSTCPLLYNSSPASVFLHTLTGWQIEQRELQAENERLEREMELAKRNRSGQQINIDEDSNSTIQFSDDHQDEQDQPEKVSQSADFSQEANVSGFSAANGAGDDDDDLDWGSDIEFNCV